MQCMIQNQNKTKQNSYKGQSGELEYGHILNIALHQC